VTHLITKTLQHDNVIGTVLIYGRTPTTVCEQHPAVCSENSLGTTIATQCQSPTDTSLPEAKSKIHIVVSRWNEDVSWLSRQNRYSFDVCNHKGSPYSRFLHPSRTRVCNVPVNLGAEGSAYSLWILNRWDDMPARIAFLDGSERSWHQEFDIFLEIEACAKRNLPYIGLNRVIIDSDAAGGTWIWAEFRKIWDAVVKPHTGQECPKRFVGDGSGQFLVTKAAIKKWPKALYEDILAYNLGTKSWPGDTEWRDGVNISYQPGGRGLPSSRQFYGGAYFMEWIWHAIFGDESTGGALYQHVECLASNNKWNDADPFQVETVVVAAATAIVTPRQSHQSLVALANTHNLTVVPTTTEASHGLSMPGLGALLLAMHRQPHKDLAYQRARAKVLVVTHLANTTKPNAPLQAQQPDDDVDLLNLLYGSFSRSRSLSEYADIPTACTICKTGAKGLAGDDGVSVTTNGICPAWCSEWGYCGNYGHLTGSVDCRLHNVRYYGPWGRQGVLPTAQHPIHTSVQFAKAGNPLHHEAAQLGDALVCHVPSFDTKYVFIPGRDFVTDKCDGAVADALTRAEDAPDSSWRQIVVGSEGGCGRLLHAQSSVQAGMYLLQIAATNTVATKDELLDQWAEYRD